MSALSSTAKSEEAKSVHQQDQDWTFGISEFDPSNPFLDDSALLGGLTPDWCGDFQFQLPLERHDHSLTSHEASSDEEHEAGCKATSSADISNKPFGSRDWARSTSYSAPESFRPQYETSTSSDDQHHANGSNVNAAWHPATNRPVRNTSSSTGHYNLDYDDESVASDSSLVKFTSSGRSRSGTSTQNTRSISTSNGSSHSNRGQNHDTFAGFNRNGSSTAGNLTGDMGGGGIGGTGNSSNSNSSSGGGRGNATGRKKATEQARTVLMDWLHENKDHPYPTRVQKSELSAQTGLTVPQIVHWMSNVRKRRLIPLMRGKREPTSKIDRQFLAEIAARTG